MKTTVDIKRFCSPDNVFISNPFSHGEYTYATDGNIAVRVPRLPDVAENPTAPGPSIKTLFRQVYENKYKAMPTSIPDDKKEQCVVCKGSGKVIPCAECKGEGTVECDECGHEGDCKKCKGNGVTLGVGAQESCEDCGGLGYSIKGTPVHLGNKNISSIYLRQIATLPNPAISPSTTGELEVMPFKFDGGEGIVMPMRV